jgi:hypothetical protein
MLEDAMALQWHSDFDELLPFDSLEFHTGFNLFGKAGIY